MFQSARTADALGTSTDPAAVRAAASSSCPAARAETPVSAPAAPPVGGNTGSSSSSGRAAQQPWSSRRSASAPETETGFPWRENKLPTWKLEVPRMPHSKVMLVTRAWTRSFGGYHFVHGMLASKPDFSSCARCFCKAAGHALVHAHATLECVNLRAHSLLLSRPQDCIHLTLFVLVAFLWCDYQIS